MRTFSRRQLPIVASLAAAPRATWREATTHLGGTWAALIVAVIAVDVAIVATYFHLPSSSASALKLSFPVQFKNWVLWTLLAPIIVVFVRVMLARRWAWWRRVAYAITLGAALALSHVVMEMISLGLHMAGGGHARAEPMSFFSYHLWHGVLTFVVLFTVAVLIESDQASRAREVREAHLQEQVSRAQLQMLRMQLQPHFLFNTLNSISALVDDDVRAGQRMIGRLSDFLRLTLSRAGQSDVALHDEIQLVRTYLELERTRFADRLSFEIDVEPEAEQATVPSLVLQPLVENAIKHGIQPSLNGGTVTIRAGREGDWLVIDVLDDGVGLPTGFDVNAHSGIGVANTRERLRHRFGERQRFSIDRGTPTGTRVTIHVPWQEAPDVGIDAGERVATLARAGS
jgi:two-component system LytT family sensor kinase